jgi:hypothetical protein
MNGAGIKQPEKIAESGVLHPVPQASGGVSGRYRDSVRAVSARVSRAKPAARPARRDVAWIAAGANSPASRTRFIPATELPTVWSGQSPDANQRVIARAVMNGEKSWLMMLTNLLG